MSLANDFDPIAAKITIGDRELPLRYTMRELADIEEKIGPLDDLKEIFLKGRRRLRNMALALCVMGNSGLEKRGQTADLTEDWLLNNMRQDRLQGYQAVLMRVFLGQLGKRQDEKENPDAGK